MITETNLFTIYKFDIFNPDARVTAEKITLVSASNFLAQDAQ
jgi:hypothetical protein